MRRILSSGLRAINAVLRPLNLRLQHSPAPTRSFGEFCSHLKAHGLEIRTVIDVGVGSGTPALYDAFPDAAFVLVEPVVENRPALDALSSRLRARVALAAAGAVNGQVTIHVHDDLTGSSVLRQAEGTMADGASRRVPLVRLDSLLPVPPVRPCLVKLDTQGTELDVIEGLGERLADVDVFIIETSLMPFRSGAPEFAEVVGRLHVLGFVVYDILEGHMRALDRALAQVDLAMVRAYSPLRRDSRFFSDAQFASYQKYWRARRGSVS